MPSVKKWADDAVLQKLMTNVIDTNNGYKANVYSFESVKNRKTLSITYNYKHPIDEKIFSGFGSPESWVLNNKFNFQEVNWPADTDEKTIKNVTNDLENSNYNVIENYLKSEKIIELAKKEGLGDFIDKHKDMAVKENNVWLSEVSDDNIEWNVTYFVGKNDSAKYEHTFMAKFEPETGNLIKKSIK